jgi:superfamily II DNA or RNA helicase
MDHISDIQNSLYTAFIDQTYLSKNNIKPRLIINRPKDRENLSYFLLTEFSSCESFTLAVAFITEAGLMMIKSKLLDLHKRGIRGRILTSDFLKFNSPKMFQELLKIKNAEIRIYESKGYEGFHIKGYSFNHGNYDTLIIGSSNLTVQALKTNHEMNLMVTSMHNGEIINRFYQEFDATWSKSLILSETWIDQYRHIYQRQQINQQINQQVQSNIALANEEIEPNLMQKSALSNLNLLRKSAHKKALLISATGTGKTFLSAFDVKAFNPDRMLFIVHREQILKKAREDFKKILGGKDTDFGIYSGNSREIGAKYLFATIQTVSRNFQHFGATDFDYIIIDEVHKAGADSYLKVIEYFHPKFMLGMTATPERNDDFDIFKLFDHQIAYEIRLHEALQENMLCPFHYHGISEFKINDEVVDELQRIGMVNLDERIDYLLENINFYGYSGDRLRGLIFCSRNDEAKKLSDKLNQRGLKTKALSGSDPQEKRQEVISSLEEGNLEYIITVDIFNEGIDIPSINQVIFLRQTQSSIIFIQQLGRGLRKHPSKDFVTIIDFIGNYDQNYLIPIALSSDQSFNKGAIREEVHFPHINGLSSVNFDDISKQKIFNALSKVILNHISVFDKAYQQLKYRLNRLILPSDFIHQKSIDPEVISQRISYLHFLKRVEDTVNIVFTDYESKIILWFEKEILNAKRKHEIILLQILCERYTIQTQELIDQLNALQIPTDQSYLDSMMRVLNLTFFSKVDAQKYGEEAIVTLSNHQYILNSSIINHLKQNQLFTLIFKDYIHCALLKSEKYNNHLLMLYQKYTRKDVCRLLHWHKDETSTMFGYKIKHHTCPIFVTYHKNENTQSSIQYHDHFLSPDVLHWYTRSNRKLDSIEVQSILRAKEEHTAIHIFVKKDDDEGLDFYYLGEAQLEANSEKQTQMSNGSPVVSMNLVLNQSVPLYLYEYLIRL